MKGEVTSEQERQLMALRCFYGYSEDRDTLGFGEVDISDLLEPLEKSRVYFPISGEVGAFLLKPYHVGLAAFGVDEKGEYAEY